MCCDNPQRVDAANLVVEGNLVAIDGDGTGLAYGERGRQSIQAIPVLLARVRCPRALRQIVGEILGRRPEWAVDRQRLRCFLDPMQMQLLGDYEKCFCGRRIRGPRRDSGGQVKLRWIDVCRCGRRTAIGGSSTRRVIDEA